MSAPLHITRLQQHLQAHSLGQAPLLSVPGCWDGLTALLIEQAGFDCAFLTGGGLSMTRLGQPDLGLVTAQELIDSVSVIRERVSIPLIVDGDTGFGGILNLQRSVRLIERAGASAIQIEDQTFPKRCGHLAGKTVVPVAEAVGRIKAAVDAREHMLIIARTDALALEGLDAALDRAEQYKAAGADLLFIEGPRNLPELDSIAHRFATRIPLIHNLVEGGVSPVQEGRDLEQRGFAIALHPLLLLHGFIQAAPGWLEHLRQTKATTGIADQLATLKDINHITGITDLLELGKRYE